MRFVTKDAKLFWDEHARLPGRGAYVHRTLACWSKMSEPGLWEHVLRLKKGSLPKDAVVEAARSARVVIEEAAKLPACSSKKVRL